MKKTILSIIIFALLFCTTAGGFAEENPDFVEANPDEEITLLEDDDTIPRLEEGRVHKKAAPHRLLRVSDFVDRLAQGRDFPALCLFNRKKTIDMYKFM